MPDQEKEWEVAVIEASQRLDKGAVGIVIGRNVKEVPDGAQQQQHNFENLDVKSRREVDKNSSGYCRERKTKHE